MKSITLIDKSKNKTYHFDKKSVSIGSNPDNDLVITGDAFISGSHAIITFTDSGFVINDDNSTNGTCVNKRNITSSQLSSGDVITVGDTDIQFITHISTVNAKYSDTVRMTIGRNPESHIFLNHIQVSWHHATVVFDRGDVFVEDNGSANGVYLNDKKITKEKLKKGDILKISIFTLVFDGKEIKYFSEEGRVRLDVLSLKRIVDKEKIILNDISFTIYPCEFVAIVGSSGAGKSTLMKALSGVVHPEDGDVYINGSSFYDNIDFFRLQLGYVPQDDIVHEELTVYKALYYAASLRLPEDVKKEELHNLIEEILGELELKERRDTQIKRLSGGQRKRVSIGVELLTRPSLFFLDEPTSGLDPAIETRMMELMNKLSKQGRTIILVTHVTKNIKFCDQVVFLAKGGYLVFFGHPDDALKYFEVNEFTDIYNKIESEGTSEEWAEKFEKSPYYQKSVSKRMIGEENLRDKPAGNISGPSKGASFIRQFFILSARYAEILVKDSKNLAIILLQAPIIAILLALVFKKDIFNKDPDIGDGNAVLSLIFFLVCVSIWFGTSNAAKEIVKEKSIYERERMINLQVIPYILSKFTILAIICAIQCAILIGIVSYRIKFPDGGNSLFYLDVYSCVYLTSLSGVGMGLLVSSIVSNVDKATSIVPILLIPQLIFSGAIIPLKKMDKISKFISHFAVSKWAVGLLGAMVNINKLLPKHMLNLLKQTFDIDMVHYYNILSTLFLLFIILTCIFQKRKDVKY